MPDLLLELFSEEIPARMQGNAAKDLERLVVGALSDRGLMFEGVKAFAGPRRLTLAIAGLPAKQPDVREEKKGPRVGAPEKAIEGFLRGAGVTLAQCEKQSDGKGEFYVAVIDRKGRATAEVLSEILPEAFAKLPWPKSMRFPGSPVRWVRPLHGIVATFDGEAVPFEFAGVTSGRTTMGHRFLSQGPIEVRRFEDYEKKLRDAHVILDAAERKEIILHDAKQKAFALGLELIEDEGLLEEVAGLAEWPVVLIGKIEDQFMDVPPEILQTSMRTHQKYFSLRDPKTGKMAHRFAVVANMAATDGGKEIVAGNERVLRARLSDAKFFWDQDRKVLLWDRVDALKNTVFHANAGTVYDRAIRISYVAEAIARLVSVDEGQAHRAGLLAKADLTSGLVTEFPELQGIIGGYLAQNDHEDIGVATAIRDHYLPEGPDTEMPSGRLANAVAASEKLDSLVSLWRAGEKPSGSGDKFAQRRAALSLIRIVLENKFRISLSQIIAIILLFMNVQRQARWREEIQRNLSAEALRRLSKELLSQAQKMLTDMQTFDPIADQSVTDEVLVFLADRLKVALREKGTRHDLIDAVFSLGNEDDLVRLVARVEALQSFLKTDEGANLLAGYKRAANILKAEEKKDKATFEGEPTPALFKASEEKSLAVALSAAQSRIADEIKVERFVEAMGVMASLRPPVDAFFERVKVNDNDPKVRGNRLKLLSRLRATLHLVADFSKIEG